MMRTVDLIAKLNNSIRAVVRVYYVIVHDGGCGEGPEFDITDHEILGVWGTGWHKYGEELLDWQYEIVHAAAAKKLTYDRIYDDLLVGWVDG